MGESAAVSKGRKRALFVTFEGIEGSGKSTQVRLAAAWLRARGARPLVTREPGGTRLGARLRRALLHSNAPVDPAAELLLMVADRRQHLSETIQPALAEGRIVLCDRYADASRAYQGAGRKLGLASVDELHARWASLAPRRTYLFDCPVPIALERVHGRGAADRFESESDPFHERVRRAYLALARREPKRFVVLDARRTPDEVFAELVADLSRLLPKGTP
jgi:dTMP kinase